MADSRLGGKVQVLLGLSIGFSLALLLSLVGAGQKDATQEPAITLAVQSVQSAKMQLAPPARLQSLRGVSMKRYEENKLHCEQDVARRFGKALGSTALIGQMMKGCEALALVDDRLGGEGTGKILGINDPTLGVVIFFTFGLIWVLYATSTKELGNDDGLGLS